MSNGFLLGAGASFELSMPLVDELTKTFKSALLRNIDKPYYSCPDKIKNVVRSLLLDKDLNYEEILGRIEIETMRNRDEKLHNDWHWLLGRYNEAIFILLLDIHERNLSYIEERLELLAPIGNFITDKPLWVFSLNHDLLFEMLCAHLNIPVKFGFGERVSIGKFQFDKLSRDHMDKNKFSFLKGRGVNLVKIHGALDLFVQGNDKEYFKIVNESSWNGIVKDVSALVASDTATKDYGGRVANEVTYNDDNGELQFLRMSIMSGKHKYSRRVQHNLDEWFFKIFQGHINHVEQLYCIGYSFGDSHINNVIYEWMSFSEKRKITIVDPAISSIPLPFRHLKEQVTLIQSGFLQFLNQDSSDFQKNKIKLFEEARKLSRKMLINS
ncbi:SIR2 family protein [Pseudochryseolinea flava]|uniref:SIR2-like domain-containing protein n=1 Tax=Pseudochryseolinea flava TaxID=2059302 RepID=A0A364Y138_9BACT|nr:SIR2 family protein [Pseudochryseolinea flava]RAV99647.1 hypothetical protein DQQ10_18800 [Pseudochryseolinea flava]